MDHVIGICPTVVRGMLLACTVSFSMGIPNLMRQRIPSNTHISLCGLYVKSSNPPFSLNFPFLRCLAAFLIANAFLSRQVSFESKRSSLLYLFFLRQFGLETLSFGTYTRNGSYTVRFRFTYPRRPDTE